MRYALTSDECELLLAVGRHGTLAAVAKHVRRDVSVVSRQVQTLAGKAAVLEKIGHRWALTPLGRELSRWTLETIAQQGELLAKPRTMRLGATRTFATKALAPRLDSLRTAFGPVDLNLVAVEAGLDEHLVRGTVDVVFACGKPTSPLVASRGGVKERFVAVATRAFVRAHAIESAEDAFSAPHLAFEGAMTGGPFMEITARVTRIAARFNDVLCLVEAMLQDAGWAILPAYTVARELEAGKLALLPGLTLPDQSYGVWWLKERTSVEPAVDAAFVWLASLPL